jgi:hypothetical protein
LLYCFGSRQIPAKIRNSLLIGPLATLAALPSAMTRFQKTACSSVGPERHVCHAPLSGREMRDLRRHQRESPSFHFVFVSGTWRPAVSALFSAFSPRWQQIQGNCSQLAFSIGLEPKISIGQAISKQTVVSIGFRFRNDFNCFERLDFFEGSQIIVRVAVVGPKPIEFHHCHRLAFPPSEAVSTSVVSGPVASQAHP